MFNLQGSEIIVLLLIALVVVGPEKLPDAVRRFTRTYNELKKMGSGFQSEWKSALDEPMREMKETAALIQNAADPDRLIAAASADSPDSPDSADSPDSPVPTGSPDSSDSADQTVAASNGDSSPDTHPDTSPPTESVPFSSIAAANSSAAIASRNDVDDIDADDADDATDDEPDHDRADVPTDPAVGDSHQAAVAPPVDEPADDHIWVDRDGVPDEAASA